MDYEMRAFADLPTLETKRLLLRKMSLNDAEEMLAYASDAEVAKYTSWERYGSIEDTRAFLADAERRYLENLPVAWAVVLKAEGRLIGTCGFGSWQPEHRRAEIGYALARPYWGQGLTPEAVRAVFGYGFGRMGLNRIQATCMVENVASARVMEKVGMRFEGILRQFVFRRGVYEDLNMYAILADEWDGFR
jgi:ribosomal-protein-alanine N-acetyltransferase